MIGPVTRLAGCLLGMAAVALLLPGASERTHGQSPTAIAPEIPNASAEFQVLQPELWPEAKARGISRRLFDRVLGRVTLDPDVLDRLLNQPEHTMTVAEYVALIVSDERVEAGRGKLAELGPLLSKLEATFGVDGSVLLAVWGAESNFGTDMGAYAVARSLVTLATADRRRAAYWRNELLALLAVIARGDATSEAPTGSWAGAMGHTQFMPSSVVAQAVDFDGDGRRDIWASVPDALASTANFLKGAGWRAGETWGCEIFLPARFDFELSAPGGARSLSEWRATGVAPAPGCVAPLLRGPLRLLLPAGVGGPAFLIGRNFRAILKYNNSTAYGLAVGHLADRIAGKGRLAAEWPVERALLLAEREELQQLLQTGGLETGGIDGIIGEQTRTAIRAYQRINGLPQDGHPNAELLHRLRGQ